MRLAKLAAACSVVCLAYVPLAWGQAEGPLPSLAKPTELVFTPIPPCRAFVTSTALAANQARTFVVSGTRSEFIAQGGPSAGCSLPASAAAVAISLTSFSSTGTGHLRSAASGDAITGTQVLSFRAGTTETASVVASIKARKLTIKSYTGSTKLAGDITGYYAPSIRAQINADGTVRSKTSRILSVSQSRTEGEYIITVDRDMNECAIQGTTLSPSIHINFFTTEDNKIIAQVYDNFGKEFTYKSFNFSAVC